MRLFYSTTTKTTTLLRIIIIIIGNAILINIILSNIINITTTTTTTPPPVVLGFIIPSKITPTSIITTIRCNNDRIRIQQKSVPNSFVPATIRKQQQQQQQQLSYNNQQQHQQHRYKRSTQLYAIIDNNFINDIITTTSNSISIASVVDDNTNIIPGTLSLPWIILPILGAPIAALAAGIASMNVRKKLQSEITNNEDELQIIRTKLSKSNQQVNISFFICALSLSLALNIAIKEDLVSVFVSSIISSPNRQQQEIITTTSTTTSTPQISTTNIPTINNNNINNNNNNNNNIKDTVVVVPIEKLVDTTTKPIVITESPTDVTQSSSSSSSSKRPTNEEKDIVTTKEDVIPPKMVEQSEGTEIIISKDEKNDAKVDDKVIISTKEKDEEASSAKSSLSSSTKRRSSSKEKELTKDNNNNNNDEDTLIQKLEQKLLLSEPPSSSNNDAAVVVGKEAEQKVAEAIITLPPPPPIKNEPTDFLKSWKLPIITTKEEKEQNNIAEEKVISPTTTEDIITSVGSPLQTKQEAVDLDDNEKIKDDIPILVKQKQQEQQQPELFKPWNLPKKEKDVTPSTTATTTTTKEEIVETTTEPPKAEQKLSVVEPSPSIIEKVEKSDETTTIIDKSDSVPDVKESIKSLFQPPKVMEKQEIIVTTTTTKDEVADVISVPTPTIDKVDGQSNDSTTEKSDTVLDMKAIKSWFQPPKEKEKQEEEIAATGTKRGKEDEYASTPKTEQSVVPPISDKTDEKSVDTIEKSDTKQDVKESIKSLFHQTPKEKEKQEAEKREIDVTVSSDEVLETPKPKEEQKPDDIVEKSDTIQIITEPFKSWFHPPKEKDLKQDENNTPEKVEQETVVPIENDNNIVQVEEEKSDVPPTTIRKEEQPDLFKLLKLPTKEKYTQKDDSTVTPKEEKTDLSRINEVVVDKDSITIQTPELVKLPKEPTKEKEVTKREEIISRKDAEQSDDIQLNDAVEIEKSVTPPATTEPDLYKPWKWPTKVEKETNVDDTGVPTIKEEKADVPPSSDAIVEATEASVTKEPDIVKSTQQPSKEAEVMKESASLAQTEESSDATKVNKVEMEVQKTDEIPIVKESESFKSWNPFMKDKETKVEEPSISNKEQASEVIQIDDGAVGVDKIDEVETVKEAEVVKLLKPPTKEKETNNEVISSNPIEKEKDVSKINDIVDQDKSDVKPIVSQELKPEATTNVKETKVIKDTIVQRDEQSDASQGSNEAQAEKTDGIAIVAKPDSPNAQIDVKTKGSSPNKLDKTVITSQIKDVVEVEKIDTVPVVKEQKDVESTKQTNDDGGADKSVAVPFVTDIKDAVDTVEPDEVKLSTTKADGSKQKDETVIKTEENSIISRIKDLVKVDKPDEKSLVTSTTLTEDEGTTFTEGDLATSRSDDSVVEDKLDAVPKKKTKLDNELEVVKDTQKENEVKNRDGTSPKSEEPAISSQSNNVVMIEELETPEIRESELVEP